MSSDIAISVKNLAKTYRIFGHPGDRIKQAFTFGQKQFHKEFTALRDVSFEIKQGETVGLVGRNGSGKSTLLQLICGILKPTAGEVQVNGRISALLELGAGFNPEFTGRENVYFQGVLMGLTKAEMDERFDDITAFADIGEFIDQPVRTYSSGMFVRLAFAVAVAVEPDILVVDEALSVGDIGFQQKCLERIREIQEAGVTIFLVSHDILLMRNFGDTLIYLDNGRIRAMGDPETVGEVYIRDTALHVHREGEPRAEAQLHEDSALPNRIWEVRVSRGENTVRIHVAARLAHEVTRPEIVIQLRDSRGYIIYGRHARDWDIALSPTAENGVDAQATLELDVGVFAGDYGVSVSLNRLDANGMAVVLDKQVGIASLQVPPPPDAGFHGCVNLAGRWLREVPADRARKGISP
jgi:ABC-type polysaccharide/polyol phosphate transport system ATPase subunit